MIFEIQSLIFILTLSLHVVVSSNLRDNSTDVYSVENEDSRVLSRRKRFLTFPDGSSLQLVFCVQTAALIPIGDIFLYGNTAGLAWNLPADAKYVEAFLDKEKAKRRGDTVTNVNYIDESGRVIARVPYKKRPIVNPAFAKRSVDEPTYKEKLKIKIDRLKMHDKQKTRDYLKKEHLDEYSIDFHRSNRLELLRKIEKLFTALGRDGRQCVLYKLCEAAQHSDVQGAFLEEFLRIIFTLPKGKEFEYEEDREYDEAHTITENCAARYPGCEDFQMPLQI